MFYVEVVDVLLLLIVVVVDVMFVVLVNGNKIVVCGDGLLVVVV